ncbi:S1C family serine protease [Tundrisphaera sp. TA3]|uniref:S1C family serine protease n=1 Tax=Tundrisphaera sp. TA3 TaxID=3435775 RepID=UPI003EB71B6D
MASIFLPHSSLVAFARRNRGLARRTLVFLLALPVGAALVFLTWPRPEGSPIEAATTVANPPISLADAALRAQASTVALEYGGSDTESRKVATGVVVDDQGGVLSVKVDAPTGAATIWAIDSAGHRHKARWLASDPETGLSLLDVDADDIIPIRPSSRGATLGEEVLLIGNPYGLGHSVGRGFVAGLGRRLDLEPSPLSGLIQVQAPIHPGDNGALLADLRGEWLGLVRGGLASPNAQSSGDHGLGFAIPADEALWIAGRLRAYGKVGRAYLGIHLGADSPDEPGAAVSSLVADGPAARAGLQPKDRVIALADHEIRSGDDLTDRLDRLAAGATVDLDYLRDSVPHRVSVLLAPRPARKPAPSPSPPGPPPSSEPPRPTIPREILDQIDRLERRLQEIERREKSVPPPGSSG